MPCSIPVLTRPGSCRPKISAIVARIYAEPATRERLYTTAQAHLQHHDRPVVITGVIPWPGWKLEIHQLAERATFMSRLTEEHAARRILPSNRFDCELPPDVRTELNRPKRPRILGRQKTATLNAGANWPLYLVLLVCAATLGGSIATWRQVETAERARNKAISQPSLAPQPAPTPITPMPGLASRWKEYLANNPPAPRAALVKLPPPRARRLDAEWMLPSSGNRLGDTWVVGNTPWVWIWAPGATRADWIDP